VAELQRRMSSAEFAHWVAFYLSEAGEVGANGEPIATGPVRKLRSSSEAIAILTQALGRKA